MVDTYSVSNQENRVLELLGAERRGSFDRTDGPFICAIAREVFVRRRPPQYALLSTYPISHTVPTARGAGQ